MPFILAYDVYELSRANTEYYKDKQLQHKRTRVILGMGTHPMVEWAFLGIQEMQNSKFSPTIMTLDLRWF